LNLWLAQGISRGEKMDYTIQKAVELGVTKIIPLITERCNVRLDEERSQKRLQHWEKIIISATEQCGRNQIPEILPPQSLTHWLKNRVADYFFVLSPTATQKLSEMSIPKTARIALLIGPEGGLSDQEIDYLTQQQFIPISLGPRILRTETAAIAAITAFQCYFGDL
jgi:16S rRNA (uracil1498-N3)-methyltransferase